MEASVQRDSLVYVPAAAAYAIVFAASDDGVCEVGLIDPGADDYSLSVPTASVEPMVTIRSRMKTTDEPLLEQLADSLLND